MKKLIGILLIATPITALAVATIIAEGKEAAIAWGAALLFTVMTAAGARLLIK